VQIKNIPTGPGDDIKVDATWAKGDTKNVIATTSTSPSFLMFGGTPGQFGSAGSIAFGPTTDGIYAPGGSIHLTESYGVRGAFNHNWDPYWSSSLFGGMGWVRYDSTAQANYCAAIAVSIPGQGVSYTCTPNYNLSLLCATPLTRQEPDVHGETIWTHLDTGFGHGDAFACAPYAASTLAFKSQDTVSLRVGVRRNFDPERLTSL
jgi:hypothetical protein